MLIIGIQQAPRRSRNPQRGGVERQSNNCSVTKTDVLGRWVLLTSRRKKRHYKYPILYPDVSFVFSTSGGGTDPQELLMRCGDVARNPGPDRVPIGSVKSLQITWDDGRFTWIKPYRVKISFAEIGAKVTVKWGKSKKPYPGIITGIELIRSPTSLINDSGQELCPPSPAKSVPCDPTVLGPRDQTAAVPNYDGSHAHLRANNSATCTNSVPINVEIRQASSQSSTPADAA